MIDRRQRQFFLRAGTLTRAAAVSFALFALLPVLAAICVVAGWIAFAGCWISIIAVGALGYGGVIGGGLAFVGGLIGKDGKVAGGGFLAFIVGAALAGLLQAMYSPFANSADIALRMCSDAGSYLFLGVFIGKNVCYWSWAVLGAALLVAMGLLLTIGLLRCEGTIKYSLFRIGYTCPNCHHKEVPKFLCPKCGTLIEDLGPTTYGIWYAKCGTCGSPLPTTDLGGRLKLEKVCKWCRADLRNPTLGRMGEFAIEMVGAASSGKTNLMVSSIWQLERQFAPENGLVMSLGDPTEEKIYRTQVGLLEKGEVIPKTSPLPIPKAFNVSLRRGLGRGCRLYLYDAAGEDYAEEERLASHTFHRFLDGIVFVIDPFAEEDVRRRLSGKLSPADVRRINPAAEDASEILARLINSSNPLSVSAHGGLFPVPVAVVVTKMDAFGLEKNLGGSRDVTGSYLSMRAAAQDAFRQSDRIRSFLDGSGLADFLSLIESRFARVGYFGVSSLGRPPDPTDRTSFRPRGVLAPLVWLCFHARAFSDSTLVSASVANLLRLMSRSLRGLEGTRSKVVAWSLVHCAGALALCATWYGIGILRAAPVTGQGVRPGDAGVPSASGPKMATEQRTGSRGWLNEDAETNSKFDESAKIRTGKTESSVGNPEGSADPGERPRQVPDEAAGSIAEQKEQPSAFGTPVTAEPSHRDGGTYHTEERHQAEAGETQTADATVRPLPLNPGRQRFPTEPHAEDLVGHWRGDYATGGKRWSIVLLVKADTLLWSAGHKDNPNVVMRTYRYTYARGVLSLQEPVTANIVSKIMIKWSGNDQFDWKYSWSKDPKNIGTEFAFRRVQVSLDPR